MAENNPLLSVGITSYNQERFIARAIEGVLEQDVNFDIEVIISDDGSDDNTQNIIRELEQKYPGRIKAFLSTENLGGFSNATTVSKNARGKYFTWLDGDDYWDYDGKLQTQVDFLENHEEYSGCFHDAKIIHESDPTGNSNNQAQGDFKFYSQFNEYRTDFYPWHLLQRNIIPTASLVFRNNFDLQDAWCTKEDFLSLNWAVHLMIIKDSKFRYFNESWSVYRDHPKGLSKKHKLNDFKKANIKILKALLEDNYYGYLKRDIYESMAHEYLQLMLDPKSADLSDGEFEALSRDYLASCTNVAKYITKPDGK